MPSQRPQRFSDIVVGAVYEDTDGVRRRVLGLSATRPQRVHYEVISGGEEAPGTTGTLTLYYFVQTARRRVGHLMIARGAGQ